MREALVVRVLGPVCVSEVGVCVWKHPLTHDGELWSVRLAPGLWFRARRESILGASRARGAGDPCAINCWAPFGR